MVGQGELTEVRCVWLPDLADDVWLSQALTRHAGPLGLQTAVTGVELLDARLTHPHRPESPLCRGWATCVVTTRDGAAVRLYVKGYPDADAGQEAWRQELAARPGSTSRYVPDLHLVVWRFPEDPRLATLPELADPSLAGHMLPPAARDALGPLAPDELCTTVVRYQPEASATVRVGSDRDGAPTVFAKHLAGGGVAEVSSRHEQLWSTGDVRVAEPLGVDEPRQVLWTRGVPGLPLADAHTPSELPAATAELGVLLGTLHATPVDAAPRLTVDELLTEASKKADKLAHAHPAVGSTVFDLVRSATRRRGEIEAERTCTLHGDFHLDQLVSSPEGPVLVDLDSMIHGAPEIDLGEFVVDLALRGLPEDVAADVVGQLLTTYAGRSGVDVALLEVCADAEFVNRCYRHLRRHAPGWQSALEAELERHAVVRSLLAV